MKKKIELVLVQLGKSNAKHLWKNIRHLQQQWPGLKITLIGDQKTTKDRCTNLGIDYVGYEPNEIEKQLVFSTAHDSHFRKGFWNFSLLRLFAILKYVEDKGTGVVIHIESDVLLMKNFPFDVFSTLTKPAWLRFNESHDVASIFAIPNKSSAEWLRTRFYDLLSGDKHLTDMTMLSRISHKDPERIELLPVAENENDPILRKSDISEFDRLKVSEFSHKYGGVFDSAPIGMWLLGQDPRNHRGRLRRYINLSNSYIQPNQIEVQSIQNEKMITYGKGTPIFDLHVHSKEIKYFTNGNSLYVSVESSKKLTKGERFLPWVFIRISLDYFSRRGILKVVALGLKNFISKN